jgi:protein ImuA
MPLAPGIEPDHRPRAPADILSGHGALHEFYGRADADGASLCALAMVLAAVEGKRFTLWIRHAAQDRETGAPYPAGLWELGLDPADLLLLRVRDAACALQAGLEGARCAGIGAVIIEFRGESKAYDLTASRRLALAARASGVRVLVVRAAAFHAPSAAQTRWQVNAVPSRALAANAPGPPAFELRLLRARNGQEGLHYVLEWDRDARQFISRSSPAAGDGPVRPAPLPGHVVPVSFDRSSALQLEPIRERRLG